MIIKQVARAVAGVMLASVSAFSLASACSQYNNTVGFMGLDGYDSSLKEGSLYLSISSTTLECGCRNVRFHPKRADVDDALSIAMAARLAKIPLRIDLATEGNCDSAYRIYFQQ